MKSEKTQMNLEVGKVEIGPNSVSVNKSCDKSTLNMGEVNVINLKSVSTSLKLHSALEVKNKHDWCDIATVRNASTVKRKLQNQEKVIEKQFKPCFVSTEKVADASSAETEVNIPDKDIVDLTTAEVDVVTNIEMDRTLNFSTFGGELIKKVPSKPVNVIKFH